MNTTSLQQDRRALLVFFGLATLFCAVTYAFVLGSSGFDALGGYALFLLMWSPGLAGLLTSLIIYRSLSPLGLLGNRKAIYWIAACIALPIAYALLIKGGLAATGMIGLARDSLPFAMPIAGLFLSLKTALGEELGWRGFAAPVMARVFGFWGGQTLLGLAWFLFHVPALLGTSYGSSPHPLFGNAVFFLSCMMLSYFLGWVRMQGNSVWPSALFHASHNFYFLYLFEPVTQTNPAASYLIGEQGLLCAIVQVALAGLAVVLWRRERAAAISAAAPASPG